MLLLLSTFRRKARPEEVQLPITKTKWKLEKLVNATSQKRKLFIN